MCNGKVAYESRQAARFFGDADGLRPYPCPKCKRWHLTSKRVSSRTGGRR